MGMKLFLTKPTSGTGLGLGIVKRLVQLYSGEIKADSNVGKGSTFIVVIPVGKTADNSVKLSPKRIHGYH